MDREEIIFSGLDVILYLSALIFLARLLKQYTFQKLLTLGASIRLVVIFFTVFNLYDNYGTNLTGNDSILYYSMGKNVSTSTYIDAFGSSGTTFMINMSGFIQKLLPVSYTGMAILSFIILMISVPKLSGKDKLPFDAKIFSLLINNISRNLISRNPTRTHGRNLHTNLF